MRTNKMQYGEYYLVQNNGKIHGVDGDGYQELPYAQTNDVLLLRGSDGDWGEFRNLSREGDIVGCKFGRLKPITAKFAKKLLAQQSKINQQKDEVTE